MNVRSNCDHHLPIISTDRMDALLDIDSGTELFSNITSVNPLNFPNYEEKLAFDKDLISHGKIMGNEAVVAIMDPRFRMGSMGSGYPVKSWRAVFSMQQNTDCLSSSSQQAEALVCRKGFYR